MKITEATLLVIDTETTGPEPTEARVVEVGAAYMVAGLDGPTFRQLVNPGEPIPEDASAIHGIHDEDVAGAPTFATFAPQLRHHVDGCWAADNFINPPVLAGYNALHYDVPLLDLELERACAGWRLGQLPTLDPIVWLKVHQRGLKAKLGMVCARFGISLENAHTAAADARATGRLLLAMVACGMVPDSVPEALAQQATFRARLAVEDARWRYHLYQDRETGVLRVGFGKHRGDRLVDVPTRYLEIVLGFDDLPREVRWEVSFEVNRRRGFRA